MCAEITRAVSALFVATFAYVCTLRATATAVAYSLYTFTAVVAVVTPAISFTAILTDITATAEIFITVITVFSALRADNSTAIASVAARTYIVGTVIASFTITAVIAFSDTIYTSITATANIRFSTVCTFFITFGTYSCTIRATSTAITNCIYAITAITAVVAPSAALCTIFTIVTAAAEIFITIITMLIATRTNNCTLGTSVSVIANI